MTHPLDNKAAVGRRIRRVDDPRLLRGRGQYVDDVRLGSMLHVAFVRSPIAHGLVTSIDTRAAAAMEGVVLVLTAKDLDEIVEPMVAESDAEGYQACPYPGLAHGKVLFVGQPVAAVVASDRYTAEDGAAMVFVDYEELAPVVTLDDALGADSPQLHEDVEGNLFNQFHLRDGGDIDAALDSSARRLSLTVANGRCAPAPMEARGVVADFDRDKARLTVWVSHQAPHLFRTGLSRFVGLPESSIRVITPDVGGGFGSKLIVYPEDLVVVAASRIHGGPVKWVSDRREDLQTSMHGREQVVTVEAGYTDDGRILGLRAEITASNGAFAPWPFTAALDSGQASENILGPYRIEAYERKVRAVATNKAPMGPYRGVGRVIACFAMERLIDEIGHDLGLDPFEIRSRNVVRSYPHHVPTGLVFESGSSAEALDMMRHHLEYDQLREQHESLRSQGIHRGVGLASVVEHHALGPQEVARKGIDIALSYESAVVRLEPDGVVTVLLATHDHGQGHRTTFAQLVADEFGVPVEAVEIRFGDTAMVPYGFGTWASRSLVYGGGAAIGASKVVKEKAATVASHILEASVADIVFDDGVFHVAGSPTPAVTLAEVSQFAYHQSHRLPEDVQPGLEATYRYRAPDPGTFSNALHAAVVEVDTEIGSVEILRYVVIEDCGTMVNPTIVEGQIHGGVAQGIGQALYEEATYDEWGQPTASTFVDYLIPTPSEIPRIEVLHIETPSPFTPNGVKGMGEGGAINPPAAIANAVTDALRPLGVIVNETPITPTFVVEAVAAAKEAHV